MGLLDDAIREHLDLKRRHGADPVEIDRAEREALGPVRRGPETLEEAEPADTAAAPYDAAAADRLETSSSLDSADELWADDDPAWADEDEDEHPPLTFDAPPAHDEPEPPPLDLAPPVPAPDPSPDRGSLRPSGGAGDETVEYRVDEALAQDPEPGEDVLEETPEFLSETPDHDRLWFEQRPPRDFDFDG